MTAPVALGLLLAAVRAAAQVNPTACRCQPGEPCWPTPADLDTLSSQLTVPVVNILPAASACYTSLNSDACAAARANWTDGNWRADQIGALEIVNMGAFQQPNGTVETCFIDTSLGESCSQGSIPVVGVDARSVEDVQAAVKFSRAHDLRVVVKNTGHDFLGRSAGRNAFMIWTHHLKSITISDSFRAVGAPASEAQEAVTIGAGVQWREVYDALAKAGKEVVGGFSRDGSVGAAGGWAQGGGHSPIAPIHGLGVDNILEASVVLANGSAVTANAYQNTDLFWALRGGGGGTFGVVTALTFRTFPAAPLYVSVFTATFNASTPSASFRTLFTELVRRTTALKDAGWGGYITTPVVNGSATIRNFLLNPNVAAAPTEPAISAYHDYARALAASAGDFTVGSSVERTFPSVQDAIAAVAPGAPGLAGVNVEAGSWLVPRTVFEQDPDALARTLLSIPQIGFYTLTPGPGDPDATAVHPAWRTALVHAVFSVGWSEGASAAEIEKLRDVVRTGTAALRALAPDSGAYLNEASLYEPDFRQSFFGSHYPRLKAIKSAVDPEGLFVVPFGVGSEEWDATLMCRR